MEHHPYTPFVQWAAWYRHDGFASRGALPESAQEWTNAFGIVAGRIHRYLALGHPGAQTFPSSLVLDILELQNSPYAAFDLDDPRFALIEAWHGLSRVYGTAARPGDREVSRLELLIDWAQALVSLPDTGFPGLGRMLIQFQDERRRLDLTQVDRREHDMRRVGSLMELLKLYKPDIASIENGIAQALAIGSLKPTATGRLDHSVAVPVAGARIAYYRDALHRQVRAVREARGSGWQINSGDQVYGNRMDHWRNTF
jgi:hypothetical protein